MANISGKETKPEIMIRKYLFSQGFRYRKNVKDLPGKPDIVLPKYKTVIFINGCFWHGHTCAAAKLPSTRKEFWETKIKSNMIRDQKNYSDLITMEYKIIVIWQCRIKNKELFKNEMEDLTKKIKNDRN